MLTQTQRAEILTYLQLTFPGSAWNMRGDVLEQADDDAPRVVIPTMDEINSQIAAQGE